MVLEPAGTIAYIGFLSFDQVGDVANVSLYAISPPLWVISVVILAVVALRLARTRFGWGAAVVLAVFATPRLLVYQVSTLVAGLGGPAHGSDGRGSP